jgi:hypothetical protein
MKRLVVLVALAFALAAMSSVPQRVYACNTSGCATDDSTAAQVPATTDQTGKARPDSASPANSAAKGDRLDRGVQQACQSPQCGKPDEDKTQTASPCSGGSNCATPELAPVQVVGPCTTVNCASPGGAALSKAVRAVKDRIRQQRTGCSSSDC